MPKGADLLVAALADKGGRIFGISGEEKLDVVAALRSLRRAVSPTDVGWQRP